MSEKDPETKKIPGQTGTNPPQGAGASSLLVLLPLLLVVVGTFVWYSLNQKTSPPVASASHEVDEELVIESEPLEEPVAEEAPDVEATAEPETEPAAAASAPATGILEIRSDVSDADVFLDGKRVGTTPYKAAGLAPGKHRVKVQKEGYASFEKRVDLGAKQQVVHATLAAATATLRVDANVRGARVSLDGEERGKTPVELSNVKPGRHEITVSADGFVARTETIEVEGGKRDIKIDLLPPPVATLNEAVAVKHKHRIGSCDGVLRVSADKLEYDSDDKHAFSVALSDVERLALDKETLNLKVRDGKSYNFNERNDDHAALASFHERVAPTLAKKN